MLDYSSIVIRVLNRAINGVIIENIKRIYYKATTIMAHPTVLNDRQLLTEYDNYHIALYMVDEHFFRNHQSDWVDAHIKYVFLIQQNLFNKIYSNRLILKYFSNNLINFVIKADRLLRSISRQPPAQT